MYVTPQLALTFGSNNMYIFSLLIISSLINVGFSCHSNFDVYQRKMVCNFLNISGIDGTGPDVYLEHELLPGETWYACEAFCKAKEECNSFTYCPNDPKHNFGNPTQTCFLKTNIINASIKMYPSRCFNSSKQCKNNPCIKNAKQCAYVKFISVFV